MVTSTSPDWVASGQFSHAVGTIWSFRPSASAISCAVSGARTATRGPRRSCGITGPSPSMRAHGRAPRTGGAGCAVRVNGWGLEDAGQEGPGPFVLGGVEHLLGRPGLDDASVVHEDH